MDFTEARDIEWQWHQLGNICTLLQTMPVPHHSVFYRPDDLPAAQPCQSTEGISYLHNTNESQLLCSTRLGKNEG